MSKIEIGDVVSRKSYGGDILFRVERLIQDAEQVVAELRGIHVRLCADAPVTDLEKKNSDEISRHREKVLNRFDLHLENARKSSEALLLKKRPREKGGGDEDFFGFPGKILHLDGDPEYSALCQQSYDKLGIKAQTYAIPEDKQAEVVQDYLRTHRPSILVLTGHDGFIKGRKDWLNIDNYRHSKYYIRSVIKSREIEPDMDQLVIFAGGCQSYFEALIEAGSNFASSPKRILIHAYDPVLVAQSIAFAPVGETISVMDVIGSTVTGIAGIGGLESKGHFRMGIPGPFPLIK